MEEEAKGILGEFYGGVEPVDIGNLDEVKEIKTVIPATKNVVVKITKAENFVNKDNTWRGINLALKIVNGIDETGKYKNKSLFTTVGYYADPNKYTKDFFRTKQHLIGLKQLQKATGITITTVDGHLLDELLNAPEIAIDITTRKRTITVEGQEVEIMENDVRNFKAVDASSLV